MVMDILSLIKSKAVAEHLKNIDYKFSTLEAAYIVYHSDKTLQEKNEAYKEIMSTMESCEIETLDDNKNLFDALTQMMSYQNKIYDKFVEKDENAFYDMYMNWIDTNGKCDYNFSGMSYRDFDDCVSAYEKIDKENIKSVEISKHYYQSDDNIKVEYTVDLKPLNMYSSFADDDRHVYLKFAPVKIPSPFKKGDIVYDVDYPDNVCTVMSVNDDTIEIYGGGLWTTDNIISLDYCDKKLDEKDRFIYAMSAYAKGKIQLDELLRAHEICLFARDNYDKMKMIEYDDDMRKLLKLKKQK